MSSATNPSLARYRPVVLVITALAAGYTIYYIHRNFWAEHGSSSTSNLPLQRRNAVHRRAPRRSTAPSPSSEQGPQFDTAAVMEFYRSGPENYGLFPFRLGNRSSDLFLTPHQPPDWSALLEGVPGGVVQNLVEDYGLMLLISFLTSTFATGTSFGNDADREELAHALHVATSTSLPSARTAVADFVNGNLTSHPFSVARQAQGSPVRSLPLLHELQAEAIANLAMLPNVTNLGPGRPDTVAGDESEKSWSPEDDHEGTRREGQNLLNLLYQIAEIEAKNEGYAHRGVTCNSCNALPIRGIRYRCTNCADYDLCETCEAAQVHPKTHLFYKVRIPAPFLGNPRQPQPVWYPGKASMQGLRLHKDMRTRLCRETGFNAPEVDALWEQFKCLAAREWPEDPNGFEIAIDRKTFDKCFVPSTSIRPPPPNLIYDRMFYFYDTNGDGFIGFEEFLKGLSSMKSKNQGERVKRIFQGYDLDGDGYVSRKDFLYMFRAYYALTKELIRDVVVGVEDDILDGSGAMRDVVLTSQPLSSAYSGMIPRPERVHIGQGKVQDSNGDLIVRDGIGAVREDETDQGDHQELIGDLSVDIASERLRDIQHIPEDSMLLDEVSESSESESEEPTANGAVVSDENSRSERSNLPPSLRHLVSVNNRLRSPADVEDGAWPPDYAHVGDARVALPNGPPLHLITDRSQRERVLDVAMLRIFRKEARENGIAERWKRRHFYIDEENGHSIPDLPHLSATSSTDEINGDPISPVANGKSLTGSRSIKKAEMKRSSLCAMSGSQAARFRHLVHDEVVTRSLTDPGFEAADAFTELLFVMAQQDFEASMLIDVLSKRLGNKEDVSNFITWFFNSMSTFEQDIRKDSDSAISRRSRSSSKVRFEDELIDGQSDVHSTASTSPRNRTAASERWEGFDVPGPEKDVGRELLYQMTQESLNQLLDPIFKQREDLGMQAKYTASERRKHHISESDSDKRKLAQTRLARYQTMWRTSANSGSRLSSAAEDLKHIINEEHQLGSPAWYTNLEDMFSLGMLTKSRYTPTEEELAYFRSDDRVSLDAVTAEFRKEFCSNATESPQVNMVAPDDYPPSAIELHHSVAAFNDVDIDVEEKILQKPLEELLSDSGYAAMNGSTTTTTHLSNPYETLPPDGTTSDTDIDIRDPTLPHNRPNAPNSGLDHVTRAKRDGSRVAHLKSASRTPLLRPEDNLKYLMMIDYIDTEDRSRGGPGKLDFVEFQEIMNGEKGRSLAFLGAWIELASF